MKRTVILILSLFILISNAQSQTYKNCSLELDRDIEINEEQIFIGDCYINGNSHILKINNILRVKEESTLELENIILNISSGEIILEDKAQINNSEYVIIIESMDIDSMD